MPEFLGLRAGLLRTTKIFKFDPKYVSEAKWQAELELISERTGFDNVIHVKER